MELMLIVWLVSILSGLKAFVSTYLVAIVSVALGLFALSKTNWVFWKSRGKLTAQYWSDGEKILKEDLVVEDKTIPAGSKINMNSYSTHAYIDCIELGIRNKYIARSYLESKITLTLAPDLEQVNVPALTGEFPKRIAWLCYVLIGLQLLLPSDTTMKYMAGAYLLQSSYQSEFVQTALPLGQKAVLNQLKRWSEDSEELKDLLIEQTKEQK